MSEPTYTFIKGQGWVPVNWDMAEFTSLDGRRMAVVARAPQDGEMYTTWKNRYKNTNDDLKYIAVEFQKFHSDIYKRYSKENSYYNPEDCYALVFLDD